MRKIESKINTNSEEFRQFRAHNKQLIAAFQKKQEDALQNSFRLQADLAFLIVMAKEWNTHLAHLVSGSIKNDLLVSAGLLKGSFRGACHTAMINAHYMKNKEQKERAEKALEELKTRFQKEHVGVGQGS